MQGSQLQMQPTGSILTRLNRPSAALKTTITAPKGTALGALRRTFNGNSITSPLANTRRLCTKLASAASGGVASQADKMEIVEVDLGDRTYPIYIGSDILDKGELLRQHIPGKTVLIVTNTTIAPMYLDRTIAAITAEGAIKVESVLLPDGEQYKTLDVVSKIWDKALEARLDRNTTFVALGGGVGGKLCWSSSAIAAAKAGGGGGSARISGLEEGRSSIISSAMSSGERGAGPPVAAVMVEVALRLDCAATLQHRENGIPAKCA